MPVMETSTVIGAPSDRHTGRGLGSHRRSRHAGAGRAVHALDAEVAQAPIGPPASFYRAFMNEARAFAETIIRSMRNCSAAPAPPDIRAAGGETGVRLSFDTGRNAMRAGSGACDHVCTRDPLASR